MQKIHLAGAILLILGAVFALPTTCSALEAATPTKADLEAAITRIKAVGNYRTYEQTGLLSDTQALANTTTFAKEYRYLFAIVSMLESYLANYDTVDAQDLQDIIAATDDAVLGCTLRFNAAKKSQATTQPANPKTPAAPANHSVISTTANTAPSNSAPTPKTTSQPTTIATASAAKSEEVSAAPVVAPAETETTSASTPVETQASDAATTETETPTNSANHASPEILAHTATAAVTFCALGTITIRERRHHYRPGRH